AYHEFPPDLFSQLQRSKGAVVVHALVMAYMFVGLAIVCDVYFVSSLEKICEKLHMSPDVAGATFMAAGSSAPELFTSIIGVFIAKGDVGVGTIVGSAVFNILFVIGICGVCITQTVVLSWFPFARDTLFYSLSVLILILSILDAAVTWYESLLMVLLYLVYIIFMVFNQTIHTWAMSRVGNMNDSLDDTSSILTAGGVKNYQSYGKTVFSKLSFEDACFRFMKTSRFRSLTRFRSAAFIIILERRRLIRDSHLMRRQNLKTFSYDSDATSYTKAVCRFILSFYLFSDDGVWSIIKWLVMLPLNVILYFTIPDCKQTRWDRWYMITFIMAIVWIAAFSYVMVWMVAVMGYTMGIPDSIMGITFLAAGTSVPDAMASVMVARQGQGDMAVSNTLGSNVFDILLGLALPWFVKTAFVSPGQPVHINSNGMVFSVILLFLTVVVTVAAIHLGGWRLNTRLGVICLTCYAVFLTLSCLIEFNVFGYVNPPMCAE
ncbi:hypothetical protein CAPTEDRAFT_110092, partial [Capitella teleta]